MEESLTFSSLVDEAAKTLLIASNNQKIILAARTVITECHRLAFFSFDLIEEEITATNVINSTYVHKLDYIYFNSFYYLTSAFSDVSGNSSAYTLIQPALVGKPGCPSRVAYITGDALAINPVVENETLIFGWIKLPYIFPYYLDVNTRPARYDIITGSWIYDAAYVTDEEKALARSKVTDWIIQRYFGKLVNGICLLVGNDKEDPRRSAWYSQYESLKKDILLENDRLVSISN